MTCHRPKILSVVDMRPQPSAIELLQQVADVDQLSPRRESIDPVISQYDAFFASLEVRLDRALIEKASRLKVVATPSTGLDHIDVDALKDHGIELISLRAERAFLDQITSTAEQAWGLLLATIRKIPTAFDQVKEGRWHWEASRGRQLSGKTLGILGYGRLGTIVAEYAKAFRMKVLACDTEPFESEGVAQVGFEQLLAESDVLSIHIHLTEENRHLLGERAFELMRDGIVIINTSRGGTIDESVLLRALESGKVAGCGFDVIDGEWRTDLIDHPLIAYAREHDHVVITPHIGGLTWDARELALMFTAERLSERLAKLSTRDPESSERSAFC